MKRFLVQHLDLAIEPNANWVHEYDTLSEARSGCDRLWGPHEAPARQEITDTQTGERWLRADGASDWQHHKAPPKGDTSETALRVVREATSD